MSALDHKAESVRLAQLADLSYGAIEHRNGAAAASEAVEALMIATEAGVHATLYLAEQQRIANLIAWSSRDGYRPNAILRTQIEEALGLA